MGCGVQGAGVGVGNIQGKRHNVEAPVAGLAFRGWAEQRNAGSTNATSVGEDEGKYGLFDLYKICKGGKLKGRQVMCRVCPCTEGKGGD